MLSSIQEKETLKAIARLNNDHDFQVFCKWLRDNQLDLQAGIEGLNDYGLMMKYGGALAVIRVILDKAENAKNLI